MPTDATATEVDPFLVNALNMTVSELARRHGADGLFYVALQAAMAARTLGLAEAEIVQPMLAVTHRLSPVGLAKREATEGNHVAPTA